MTLQQILHEAEMLPINERRELIKSLVDSLVVINVENASAITQPHNLTQLRGLGKEIWNSIDAQQYVDQIRDEWEQHR